MNNTTKIIIWMLLNFSVIGMYFFQTIRKKINQRLNLTEVINVALASGGVVTSISILYQLLVSSKLKELLEQELGFDVIALYLGAIAAGWVSLQPIAQIFQGRNFMGTVRSIRSTNSETFFYLELSCKNKK